MFTMYYRGQLVQKSVKKQPICAIFCVLSPSTPVCRVGVLNTHLNTHLNTQSHFFAHFVHSKRPLLRVFFRDKTGCFFTQIGTIHHPTPLA